MHQWLKYVWSVLDGTTAPKHGSEKIMLKWKFKKKVNEFLSFFVFEKEFHTFSCGMRFQRLYGWIEILCIGGSHKRM